MAQWGGSRPWRSGAAPNMRRQRGESQAPCLAPFPSGSSATPETRAGGRQFTRTVGVLRAETGMSRVSEVVESVSNQKQQKNHERGMGQLQCVDQCVKLC